MITCAYISVGAFQQVRLYSHIQKSETHYSYAISSRLPSMLCFFARFCTSVGRALIAGSPSRVTPATAAEDGPMSRARERQARCVTSTSRRPSSDPERGCARSTGQRGKAAAPTLLAQTTRAPLKQSRAPKASRYPHNSSCSAIS